MNAMETRKLAQDLGIKNAAKFKKAELEAMIAEKQAEVAAELAAKQAPQAKPAKGRCTICALRPAGGREAKANGFADYCDPCYTEANWENTHSDNGHDDAGCVVMGWDIQASLDACWVCHPELNQAAADYQAKAGTARTGMRLTVPIHETALAKATAIKTRIATERPDVQVTIDSSVKGIAVLSFKTEAGTARMVWYGGSWAYDRTTNGKGGKIRNASAGLRLLGI